MCGHCDKRIPRSRVSLESYDLLNVGDEPTAEQIQTFEEISRTLRTSKELPDYLSQPIP